MFPCSVCEKRFYSLSSLKEHTQVSPDHYRCQGCNRVFSSVYELGQHTDNNHTMQAKQTKTYICHPCKRVFALRSSLEDHYRGSEAHPTCPSCGKGFENQRSFEEHHRLRGPCYILAHETVCHICYAKVQRNNISQHYLESSKHPTCRRCMVGFVDDVDFKQHCLRLHEFATCKHCGRLFEDERRFQRYSLGMRIHSICPTCQIRLKDEKKRQMLNSHPQRVSGSVTAGILKNEDGLSRRSSVSPEFRELFSTSDAKLKTPKYVRHSLSEFTAKDKFSVSASIIDPASTSNDKQHYLSNYDAAYSKYGTKRSFDVLPSAATVPHVEMQPTTALVTPRTNDGTLSSFVSQTVVTPSQQGTRLKTESRIAKSGLLRSIPEVQLNMSDVELFHPSNSTTSSEDISPLACNYRKDFRPNPQRSDPSLPALVNDLSWQFHHSMDLGLQDASVINFETNHSSLVQPPYRNTMTRLASTPSLNFGTLPEIRVNPTKPHMLNSMTVPISLHCRLCKRDSSVSPTATMCGHIFCENCIKKSVIASPKCPMCGHPLLLYYLFKLHLSVESCN